MSSLFSHQIEETLAPDRHTPTEHRTGVWVESELPPAELWQAFTEYTHLWWPVELRSSHEAHVEIGEELIIEETAEGELQPLAQVLHMIPLDVIAVQPLEGVLNGAFDGGLSFTFDEENNESIVEISLGVIKPHDVDPDAELGVTAHDLEVARLLLGGFARFIGTEVKVEDVSE